MSLQKWAQYLITSYVKYQYIFDICHTHCYKTFIYLKMILNIQNIHNGDRKSQCTILVAETF